MPHSQVRTSPLLPHLLRMEKDNVHCFLKTRVPRAAAPERAAHAQTDQHKVESVVEILLAV